MWLRGGWWEGFQDDSDVQRVRIKHITPPPFSGDGVRWCAWRLELHPAPLALVSEVKRIDEECSPRTDSDCSADLALVHVASRVGALRLANFSVFVNTVGLWNFGKTGTIWPIYGFLSFHHFQRSERKNR